MENGGRSRPSLGVLSARFSLAADRFRWKLCDTSDFDRITRRKDPGLRMNRKDSNGDQRLGQM